MGPQVGEYSTSTSGSRIRKPTAGLDGAIIEINSFIDMEIDHGEGATLWDTRRNKTK